MPLLSLSGVRLEIADDDSEGAGNVVVDVLWVRSLRSAAGLDHDDDSGVISVRVRA